MKELPEDPIPPSLADPDPGPQPQPDQVPKPGDRAETVEPPKKKS